MAVYPSDYPVRTVLPAPGAAPRRLPGGPPNPGDGRPRRKAGVVVAETSPADDVVYHSLRPIWVVMQATGFYPMQRFCRGQRGKEPSPWLALAALQYAAVVLGMVTAYSEARRQALGLQGQGVDFDGAIIQYMVYLQCAVPIALLPLYAMQRDSVAKYLREWTTLQAEFARESGRALSSCRGFSSRDSYEMVAIVVLWALAVAGVQLLLHPPLVVVALVHSTLVSALLASLWYLHGRLLRSTARALRDLLAAELSLAVPRADSVDAIRLLVLRVVALCGGLGSAVTLPMGLLLLLHFVLQTLTLYALFGQLSYVSAARLPSLGTGVAFSGMLLYSCCDTGHRVARSVKTGAVDELLAFRKHTPLVGKDLGKVIETFISTIQEVPSDVTLSGITTVNRQLFTAMLSTMVTYLVVIVQFRVSLQAKDRGTSGNSSSSTPLPFNNMSSTWTTPTTA